MSSFDIMSLGCFALYCIKECVEEYFLTKRVLANKESEIDEDAALDLSSESDKPKT